MLILKKTFYFLVLPEQDCLVWDHPVMEELLKHLFHVRTLLWSQGWGRPGHHCQPKALHGNPPCKAFPGFGPADLEGALLSLRAVQGCCWHPEVFVCLWQGPSAFRGSLQLLCW